MTTTPTPAERTLEDLRRRYRQLQAGRNQMAADIEHWNRAHPGEELVIAEFCEEIDALLLRITRAMHTGKSEEPS